MAASPYAISPQPARFDGLLYSVNYTMPAAEGDLYNANSYPILPIPVDAGVAALAVVEFETTITLTSNVTYVVLQTDLGNVNTPVVQGALDKHWIDVAWCVWTGVAGPALFVLSGGVAGANSFQQTRPVGTAPSSSSYNQFPLGGRVRIVGKSTISGTGNSSSSAGLPGVPAGVVVNIRLKLTNPR